MSADGPRSTKHRFVHPDKQLYPNLGVTYGVRYVGNISVLASTRSLDSHTRNAVTRTAIDVCCETAGLIMPGRKKKDKKVLKHLGDKASMQYSCCSANITVTTNSITIVALETNDLIAHHNLANVSFASGGDTDTMDYVAYVAKDNIQGRACHVIECPGGLASDVVSTIGQAFELRYKGASEQNSKEAPVPDLPPHPLRNQQLNRQESAPQTSNGSPHSYVQLSERKLSAQRSVDEPLIDLSSNSRSQDPVPPPLPPRNLSAGDGADVQANGRTKTVVEPIEFAWYHGSLSRHNAEALLVKKGDFLIRMATGQSSQFVLSGRTSQSGDNVFKHLLLIDPEGSVRTKDRVFDSIEQLISFHLESQLPIVSEDSELVLVAPVFRK